jgi:hypothetical protein
MKITSTTPVDQPDAINKGITATSTPLELLTFQEETKKLQKEFDLQEAVTNIGVQRIIDSVEEQYIEELNEDQKCSPSSPNQLVQGYDKGAHRRHRSLLSNMGTQHDPHHHVWTPTHQTTETMQDDQCHHFRRSQNPPLRRTNV